MTHIRCIDHEHALTAANEFNRCGFPAYISWDRELVVDESARYDYCGQDFAHILKSIAVGYTFIQWSENAEI